MWTVTVSNHPEDIGFLFPERTYCIGRNADIPLKALTTSRQHAQVRVVASSSSDAKPTLFVKDLGSQRGTFYQNVKLEREIELPATEKSVDIAIGFGKDEVRVTFSFVVIHLMTSRITTSAVRNELHRCVKILKLPISDNWIRQGTHLLCEKIDQCTLKIFCALLTATPIVSVDWLTSLVKHIEKTPSPPAVYDPLPSIDEFRPPCNPKMPIDITPLHSRINFLKGVKVIFASEKCATTLREIISIAGGIEALVCSTSISKEQYLRSVDSEFLKGGPCLFLQYAEEAKPLAAYLISQGRPVTDTGKLWNAICQSNLQYLGNLYWTPVDRNDNLNNGESSLYEAHQDIPNIEKEEQKKEMLSISHEKLILNSDSVSNSKISDVVIAKTLSIPAPSAQLPVTSGTATNNFKKFRKTTSSEMMRPCFIVPFDYPRKYSHESIPIDGDATNAQELAMTKFFNENAHILDRKRSKTSDQ